jgi:NTP pyrophosphatase (non-canonical NTP hydrolase)
MRGAVAMSSSPSTESSSYPSFRLRSIASGVTAVASLPLRLSSGAGTVRDVQLSDYQLHSRVTAVYPDAGSNLTYPALGLCGEAGECAEKVKKAIRDDGGVLSEERRAALAAELGDVLWYAAQLATEAGLDLDEIAEDNLAKLLSRRERGVLQGSGDAR